jgi:lipopolysaccharide/colanic/teichoic acid biosynthesis glycosyltransferase
MLVESKNTSRAQVGLTLFNFVRVSTTTKHFNCYGYRSRVHNHTNPTCSGGTDRSYWARSGGVTDEVDELD